MTISAEERRESIIKAVQQQGKVRVADLSREFGISEVTIRNDLELLETQGLLNRVHGGAIMGNPFYGSMNLNERYNTNVEAKKAVAEKVAELVEDGSTIQLGASVYPLSDNLEITWASSDESVATVADDGTVTAVAAGTATISVSVATDPGMTATCIVRCKLSQEGDSSSQTPDGSGDSSTQEPPAQSGVDLSAFAEEVLSSYYGESSFLQLANNEMLDGYYAGLTGVDTDQCSVYITMMSMNNGEFGLVQVKNSADVDTVKAIFQARIDYMAGDGNGPGGAWYPGPTEQWTNNSRVVSNGNYVMMVVNENCDAIVDAFNALF